MKTKQVLEIINNRLNFLETVLNNIYILKRESKSRDEDNKIDVHIFRLEDERKFLLGCEKTLAEAETKS